MEDEIEKIRKCQTEKEINDLGWHRGMILYKGPTYPFTNREVDQYMYFNQERNYAAIFYVVENNKLKFDRVRGCKKLL